MIRFSSWPLQDDDGQGLVEYALILVLVSIVLVVALTIFGSDVQDVYCDMVYSLDVLSNDMSIAACEKPHAECVLHSNAGSMVNIEIHPTDNDGPSGIAHIKFYVDDSTTAFQQEFEFHYCLSSGNDPCTARDMSSIGSGSHVITAVVEDVDGYTDSCKVTVNID